MIFENTPREMAEKLLFFNRDFSDYDEDIKPELEDVARLFEKLQTSSEFNSLAHHLDIMFSDNIFN